MLSLWLAWLRFCPCRPPEAAARRRTQSSCVLLPVRQDLCVCISDRLLFRVSLLLPLWGIGFSSCRPAPGAPQKREDAASLAAPKPREISPEEARLQREERAKQEAVATYPELGVAGTAVNREYVRRYKLYRSVNPAFFAEPDWPIHLAEMLAQDLGLDPSRKAPEASPR